MSRAALYPPDDRDAFILGLTARGWTNQQLADYLGVSLGYVTPLKTRAAQRVKRYGRRSLPKVDLPVGNDAASIGNSGTRRALAHALERDSQLSARRHSGTSYESALSDCTAR